MASKKYFDFTLDESVAIRIKNQTGFDVSGYTHSIDGSSVIHMDKRHGEKEKNKNQIPITIDDILKIPEIILTADEIKYVGKNKTGRDTIQYKKRDDGQIFYYEEIREGKKKLSAVTLRKVDTGANNVDKSTSSHTSEALPSQAPSEDTIAQSGEENQAVFQRKEPSEKPFFSAVTRAVESIQQNKGTADQWLAMIRKAQDVKQEEMDWIGLVDFLKGKSVFTKEEVLSCGRTPFCMVNSGTKINP